MQQVNLSYHTQLCLKNKHTQKYVGIETTTQVMKADYPPSWIEIKDLLKQDREQRPQYTLRLKLVSRQPEKEKSQFVLDGSKVHLINTATQEYITCSSTGEIRFDKKSNFSEDLNKHLYKASTWTVQLLRNQTKVILAGNQLITVYDEVCFKSVHNTYLTLKAGTLELSASSQLDPTKGVWNLIKANVPFIPQWVLTRAPFKKFSRIQLGPQPQPLQPPRQKKLLKSFPPQKQQILLIQDIFDVMLGFDTVYIKRHKHHNYFMIEPHLQQPSCTLANKQLTEKILALPCIYYKIETYVNSFGIQEGILCQALCGGLRKMMKEYQMMVCQFNDQTRVNGMSLQKLWYLIQSPLKVMQALSNLVDESQKCRGGQIITVLTKLLNQCTDPQVIQIYNSLFATVIQVYVQMLSKWLYEGVIEDKYGEFMIKAEEKSVNKEWTYWQEKFVVREDMVPSIFARQANEILVTGKYVNILKACNKVDQYPEKLEMFVHLQRYIALKNFSQAIEKIYLWTNEKMLDLVFNDCKMEDVLKSIKGYFFMEYGDLFVHLMDAAAEDFAMLKKKLLNQGHKTKMFSQEKIQNLFELLIRTSSANADPFKDDVSCRLQTLPIYQQMHRIKTQQPQRLQFDHLQKPFLKKDSKYVDYFTLDYKCTFPLTLIFNKKTMSKYQVLFRFLFWCKSLERQLNCSWLVLQSTKKTPIDILTPAYLLNQRMINFIKNFIYYVCYEVIEENWLMFTQNLKRVKTFEEIIKCQTNFLNKCLVESLLSNNKLLTIVTAEVGRTCQAFAQIRPIIQNIYSKYTFQPIPNNPKTGTVITQRKLFLQQVKQKAQEQLLNNKKFKPALDTVGQEFDESMRMLLREVYEMIGKQQSHLINLVNRLDEEKFYNRRLFDKGERLF